MVASSPMCRDGSPTMGRAGRWPVPPAWLLVMAALLPACSRQEPEAPVGARARDFLLARCQVTASMIPGAKPASIQALCTCSADRAVATFSEADLRTLLKNREFSADAERVMRGIRTDCMKQSGFE